MSHTMNDNRSTLNTTYYNATILLQVETIGDAFMVAGGVPVTIEDHAVRVVKQGLGMLNVSGNVLTPKDKKPVQVWRITCLF